MRITLLLFVLLMQSLAHAQTPYRVTMPREDGVPIVFNMTVAREKNRDVWIITNASEKLRVDSITRRGDSIYADMPFFDSRIVVKAEPNRSLNGFWYKGTTGADAVMPVQAAPGITWRFQPVKGPASSNVSGRYAVEFTKPDGTRRRSVAEFQQSKNKVTGTFLNPSGDYRFLEGIVTGDSLMLSCFDGSHAYVFSARIGKDGSLQDGVYLAGIRYKETWTAVRNEAASVDDSGATMYAIDPEQPIRFRFPDLDSNILSLSDERFRNKVIVLQIMGSWCPNCMDETAFLAEWYRNNRNRGVEVIGLAYEYSPDFRKAEKTLRKFQQRHKVEYPMLNTGVTTNDPQRTEKTLPNLSPIKVFPTTIFLDRGGRVRKVHAGFEGPGTGEHYEQFKKEFNATIDSLLGDQR